jgi:hypothetical protein
MIDRLAADMRHTADTAVSIAGQYFPHLPLDYSEASVANLEAILTAYAYDSHGAAPASQIRAVGLMLGAYLGEVMICHWGGQWIWEHDPYEPGETIIALKVNDFTLYPFAKVEKRLTKGPEHDVHYFYEAFRDEFITRTGSTGKRAAPIIKVWSKGGTRGT